MGKLIIGTNDLQTVNPELAKEWDFEKNNLNPSEVSAGSHKKAWWNCKKCGHSWYAYIYGRNNGNGCPRCGKKKQIKKYKETRLENGKNTLLAKRPDLAEEWDIERNGMLTPEQVTFSTAQKVHWKCKKCGYSWKATVNGRNSGKGCPVCAGQIVKKGINDLATVNPGLAEEWDDVGNGELKADQVTANNNRKVSWKCKKCGCRWEASISNRNAGTGCPSCMRFYHTSYAEQIVMYYISSVFKDTINGYKPSWLKKGELDIYIPSLKLGIEYDGERWHKDVLRDIEKDGLFKEHGINIIRLREFGCPSINSNSDCIYLEKSDNNYNYIEDGIKELFDFIYKKYQIKITIDIDVQRDSLVILNKYENCKEKKSFAYIHPELVKEWAIELNEGLMPNKVSSGSARMVYWKCSKCGFVWKSTVFDRSRGHGCPYCVKKILWKGHNDLYSQNPNLVSEWNYGKNENLNPDDITINSDKKVWWKCNKCGYQWIARVADRNKGSGCPACAGKIVMYGENDLATINPKLASEWNYSRNGKLMPEQVKAGSNQKVWWECSMCKNAWKATIYSRNSGRGCPYCGGKKVWEGHNDLNSQNPLLAYEWDYEFNGELKPNNVTINSGKRVAWICSKCGYHWKARVGDRNRGSGCPVCAGKVIISGKNDLATTNPSLALEWDYNKNDLILPTKISRGSNLKVWWICSKCGFSWEARVYSRNRGSGCPNCIKRKI